MGYFRLPYLLALVTCFASASAAAQERAPSLPDSSGGSEEEDLQQQLDDLRERLKQTEDALANAKVSPLSINGYVDFGFFYPLGNKGVGWVRDVGNNIFSKDHPP